MTAQGQAVAQAIADRIRELEAQRDELFSALKLVTKQLENILPTNALSRDERQALFASRVVIANIEAKK